MTKAMMPLLFIDGREHGSLDMVEGGWRNGVEADSTSAFEQAYL